MAILESDAFVASVIFQRDDVKFTWNMFRTGSNSGEYKTEY